MTTKTNIPGTESYRYHGKKLINCKSINYKIFNNILTFPPKNFSTKMPYSLPIFSSATKQLTKRQPIILIREIRRPQKTGPAGSRSPAVTPKEKN